MATFNFKFDRDTEIVLEIISRYLKKYFDYDSDGAVAAINYFYSIMRPMFSEEGERDFIDLNFHHDHAFSVACRIHYWNNKELQSRYSNPISWLRDINWFIVPKEADDDYQIWVEEAGYYKS